jgi:4-amino-4-deoxy-L-arabinose transferase-like glycosyltransferase
LLSNDSKRDVKIRSTQETRLKTKSCAGGKKFRIRFHPSAQIWYHTDADSTAPSNLTISSPRKVSTMRPGFWFLLTIAVAVAVTNLGAARLWDRDEPRNAQCAREMMEADNWVVPMFDGELRTHKPILIYWCQITAYKIFGVNEFAARLPSALAGILTVLLVYSIAMRLGSPHVAVWSGISLSTMFMFVLAERAATPDALLIVTTTLAIALFVRFAFVPLSESVPNQDSKRNDSDQHLNTVEFRWPSWIQWTIVYAACGLAVLAKGPVGLILPIAVMGLVTLFVAATPSPTWRLALLHTSRNLVINGWRMKPWLAVAAVLVVAGPWYLAVGLATNGEWLNEFLFTHNVSRAVKPMEGHSGPPVLYYVGTLLVGTFPWSCFAIPIGLSVWRRWKDQRSEGKTIDPMLALGIAWTVVFVGCFSLASTKLPSYVTPCHPAIALVVGWYVARAIAWRSQP